MDNRWTTRLNLGVTQPGLWMIRAIPQNLEVGPSRLLRRPSGTAKNLCHTTSDGDPARRETSGSANIRTGSSRKRALGTGVRRVCLTGEPPREGAFREADTESTGVR